MKKKATNIAMDEALRRRVRIVAAARGMRFSALLEEALTEKLAEWELQVAVDSRAVRS